MSLLQILIFPDSRLRKVASKVLKFDKKIEDLTKDLLETMYSYNGIGLAASQVNIHKRVIVIDITEEKKEPLVLINPKITILNKKDLLKEFQKTTISCKDVEFTLFGLSLTTINVIISLILSVITFKLFLNYEKNR